MATSNINIKTPSDKLLRDSKCPDPKDSRPNMKIPHALGSFLKKAERLIWFTLLSREGPFMSH